MGLTRTEQRKLKALGWPPLDDDSGPPPALSPYEILGVGEDVIFEDDPQERLLDVERMR